MQKWVIVGLIVALLVTGGAFFYQQRGETVRVSPEEKSITEKIARGESLTPKEQEQYEAMAQEGIRQYKELEKGQKEAVVPPPPPAVTDKEWPIKDTWTVQTSKGELTIIYRETKSAEGKIKVWVDKKQKKLYQQNLLDRALQVTLFVKHNGELGSGPDDFEPNELVAQNIETVGNLEFWYEVRS